MDDKDSGSIELNDGSIFLWVAGRGDREIFGHIQGLNGGVVKGTSGWYRTTVPAMAAKLAQKVIAN